MEILHGYLYLADLNPRQGSESGKVRPVLVIQTDLLNTQNHPSTWILPCTTKSVGENILRVFIPKHLAGNEHDCEIMIDQSRSIDNQRFKKKLKHLPDLLLSDVKQKLKLLGDL